MTTPLGVVERPGQVGDRADPVVAVPLGQPDRAGLGPLGVAVEHGDVLGALVEQAVADRDPGAAGADDDDPVLDGVGQRGAEGARRSPDQSVLRPEPAAVAEDHRVDRAQVGRVVGELVEQRQHRLLERVGDVEAVEAEPLGPVEQVGQVVGAEPEPAGVDDPVADPQPALRGPRAPAWPG